MPELIALLPDFTWQPSAVSYERRMDELPPAATGGGMFLYGEATDSTATGGSRHFVYVLRKHTRISDDSIDACSQPYVGSRPITRAEFSILTGAAPPAPFVGMPGTLVYVTDRYPVEIVEVLGPGRVVVRKMKTTPTSSHEYFGSQDYTIESDPLGETIAFSLRSSGRWLESGKTRHTAGRYLALGRARRYVDPCF